MSLNLRYPRTCLLHVWIIYLLYLFSGGSGISSRVKYVVDPSVQSNSYGGMRTSFSNTLPTELSNPMAPPPAVPTVPLMSSQVPTYTPNMQNSPYNSNMPPMPPIQNQISAPPSFPSPGHFTNPIQTQPPLQGSIPGAMPNQTNMYSGNIEVGQPVINAFAPPPMSAPGWNDPPMLSKSNRAQVNIFILLSY